MGNKRDPESFLKEEMKTLRESNLEWFIRHLESSSKPHSKVDGKEVLMLNTNNYLGLATHPKIIEATIEATKKYGAGAGAVPVIAGTFDLTRKFQEKFAKFKEVEASLLCQTGYAVNSGLIPMLVGKPDIVVSDELNHGSIIDGVRLSGAKRIIYKHRDISDLETQLREAEKEEARRICIITDGVFSMDGDIAPLDKIRPLCKKYKARLILDDAHSTGVLGENGGGTHEHFNLPAGDDIIMGTFSKSFAVNGGFISASKPIINYLRMMSRSYMFSASLPPVTIAAVIAGLDVLEKEPHLMKQLHENVAFATNGLRKFGLASEPKAGIIALKVPGNVDIRKLACHFHKAGIFLNAIEFPAVPLHKQRFRISIMATHTRKDLEKLIFIVEDLWNKYVIPLQS